jgi:hypothetical protein
LFAFIIITDIQASKPPQLDLTLAMGPHIHYDDVVNLTNIDSASTIVVWCPHQRLLSCDVSLMNPPSDGNCIFIACISQLQNCSIQVVTTDKARTMRNDLMDFLLEHANHIAGGLMSYGALSMLHASDIEREVRLKIFRNASISTLEDYAHWMRIAAPNRCLFGNNPELHLIAKVYSLNNAVFQVNQLNPQEYILREPIMVDPNNYDNVIYLLLHGTHYQRIITSDGCYFMNEHHPLLYGHQGSVSCTELHSTNDDHPRSPQPDFNSILDYASNDHSPLPAHDNQTSFAQDLFTSQTSDDINGPMSQDMISTADLLFSNIQEEMVEPLFDEALVSNSTFVEATNVPIIDEAAVVCE